MTSDRTFVQAAQRVCDWVLKLQDRDGAFRASERLPEVVSHPCCYAIEGLLFAHHVLGVERYREAARRAGEWLLTVQNRDGSINLVYKRQWWRSRRGIIDRLFPLRVTDSSAQAVRIWLALYRLTGDDRFLAASRKAACFLRRVQCTSLAEPNAYGGFYYARGHPMMFAWCTMFCVCALHTLGSIERGEDYQEMMEELF